MATAYVSRVFSATGINAKTTGTTTIIPAMSGRKFLCTGVFAVTTARTGTGTAVELSFGSNSTDYNNVIGQGAGGNMVSDGPVDQVRVGELEGTVDYWALADIGTNGFRVNVQAASGATAETISVFVEGIII